MDSFLPVFSGVLALVLGIVILSIFWWGLARLGRLLDGRKIVRLPGLGGNSALVNVHLLGGTVLEKMKMLGTTQDGGKGGLPHQLYRMVVLENQEGLKLYIKGDSIRMIEELPNK